jgi:hypothetical protein
MAMPSVALAAPDGAREDVHELRERADAEMATGNLAEACPLLASAYALDHAPTTLAAAAQCLDKAQKLASAHAAYTSLLALPEARVPEELRRVARARQAELGPRLSRITVRIPSEIRHLPGVRVALDGREVPQDDWDVPHPRDAGTVTVTVTVPERTPYVTIMNLAAEGADEIVDLPTMAFPKPNPSAQTTAPSTRVVRVRVPRAAGGDARAGEYFVDTTTFGPFQVAGIATFAAGAVGLGVGFVVGLLGAADYNRAAQNCEGGVCGDRNYVATAELAREKGDLGTAIGAVGVGGMAVGAGLFLFGPRPSKSNGISISPRGLGLGVGGAF